MRGEDKMDDKRIENRGYRTEKVVYKIENIE